MAGSPVKLTKSLTEGQHLEGKQPGAVCRAFSAQKTWPAPLMSLLPLATSRRLEKLEQRGSSSAPGLAGSTAWSLGVGETFKVRGYWDAINGNPSWHLVDSPMESGAPGHNRSLDAPEAIPMAAVKQVLREAGEKSELQYQQAFSDMASKLHLTLETAHQTFEQAVNELFRDEVSWGRIVAFFSFGGTLCVENIDKEMQALVSQIPSWMATYLNDHLETWIQDNGGWDTFVELHGNNVAVKSWKGQEHFNLCFLMGMIVAGVVLLGWLFSRR
ncbi:LOW QUALITY PROTEIN: bcl-2-like protein 1 [Marmota marmota marmota]|uniref:LOW QUALITY PROTEIN: bcl-2-like protein 1 n=1 Tax=Marmota marmota marmota TaxID=9994 RepID=UPI002093DAFA|nr:LOW QUALITY PROTEIN: bcl-2-like protein 1 [Marmota marmota marmota]